jgi:hypothetical protein
MDVSRFIVGIRNWKRHLLSRTFFGSLDSWGRTVDENSDRVVFVDILYMLMYA